MKQLKRTTTILFAALSLLSVSAQEYPFEVSVTGEGNPILLFPGFTCTEEVWDTTVAELSKNHECHTFTFAGFGDLPAIETPWFPQIKEGVARYIEDHGLNGATAIGHSLGGTLALWLASEGHGDLKKLIIVDGLPATGALMIPNYNSEHMVYDNPYNQQLLQLSDADFSAMAKQFATGMTLNETQRPKIQEWIEKADRKTYVYGYTDLLKVDLRDDLAKIGAEILVLGAAHPYGKEMATATYTKQFEQAEAYDLRIAEGSAHFIMYDAPDWMLEQINGFLE